MYDFLIVGTGLAGSVVANCLKSRNKEIKILLVDKNPFIGGLAYDYYNKDGILVQAFGPHIFHTNNETVWEYISKFTEFNNYIHKVKAFVNGQLLPIPINLDTINQLYGYNFNHLDMRAYLEQKAVKFDSINNSEEAILSKVGYELYELFYKNYTKKQWDLYPNELDASVCSRIPIRYNRDDRYFTDKYQGVPKYGFFNLFSNLLKDTEILLNYDFNILTCKIPYKKLIYTGPIDEFFGYRFGKLGWRGLDFKFETYNKEFIQPCGSINYPNDYEYTRTIEYKYLYQQKHHMTTICYESPSNNNKFYPIPNVQNQKIYKLYEEEAKKLENVYFVGRLGTYKYLNMDQVIEQAYNLAQKL